MSETPSDAHSLVRARRNAGTTKSAWTKVLAMTLVHNLVVSSELDSLLDAFETISG